MKVLIINGSPKGKNSTTLYTSLFLEKRFPEHQFSFLVPYQLHRFIELMKGAGLDFSGKVATQITTSKHFYDITAQR